MGIKLVIHVIRIGISILVINSILAYTFYMSHDFFSFAFVNKLYALKEKWVAEEKN